jgi:putative flavoprotein involved in K+ transport
VTSLTGGWRTTTLESGERAGGVGLGGAQMGPEFDVVVVGAGQAGLSVSHELAAAAVEHVVLERDGVGASWADRWDSFCLVTPNHTIRLPGGGYAGGDPHGFLTGAEVSSYLQGYAASFDAPVRTGVDVQSLRQSESGRLELGTGEDTITARAVVVATGAYQRALRPTPLATPPPWLAVLDAEDYRNPGALPDGAVLVVGSGQSGCQIAEELCLAGRHVVLSCGRAPWVPRRLDGRDIIDWLLETPFLDASVADLPNPMARLAANFQNTGVAGGHDLNYRTLSRLGVDLVGRLIGVDEAEAAFADDLAESVAFGDARYADVCAIIGASCGARGVAAPDLPDPPPFTVAGRDRLSLRGFGSVIVAAGYRPAYRDWIQQPDAFDDLGFPLHRDGASTTVAGLYFVGVHFLRKRKSSLLVGVGEDAGLVAWQLAGQR